jgi:CubicO group peptidase (beta-lactamase class C family)
MARETSPQGSRTAVSGVAELDSEEIVRAGLSHAPDFQPGEGWSYSNTGYDLVGLVIKAVTGRTWYD